MIKKLKIKFIVLSMSALFALLLVIVSGMNIINYNSVVRDADNTLALLSDDKEPFPEFSGDRNGLKPPMSPEVPFESRYFSVLLNSSNDIMQIELSKIASINQDDAIDYTEKALSDRDGKGFIGNFRFIIYNDSDGKQITFLDCGRKLDAFYSFLFSSLVTAAIGYAVVLIALIFFAGRIIRPIAESYEKQKRFITDAGHEIKTPLTIINANIDILEMEMEENESLRDIQIQTERLTTLTNDLVYLSRMEEKEQSLQMIDFPLSDLVSETVHAFHAPAQMQDKELVPDIQPMLTMKGDPKSIEKLISILMNNALKYSPSGSPIFIDCKMDGKQILLSVVNSALEPIDEKKLPHVFDRFYRSDSSRNSETGGHGIGLSMAQAIVSAHNGKIQAWTKDGTSFGITAYFRV